MKVEDVPREWVTVAGKAAGRLFADQVADAILGERNLDMTLAMKTAIAAVAPLIAAAEREACAKVALYYPTPVDAGPHEAHGRDSSAVGIAAAIRARSDAP